MTVASASVVLGLKEKIAYGCGDYSSNLLWGISGAFLMYYYTDTLRLAAADIAVLLLVTRVIDAFADPAVGYLIDRSGGKLVRPLLKWLAVPFGFVAFLVFLPVSDDARINLAWAYVSYLLFGLIYASINTPYGILQNLMTTDPQSRISVGAFRMMGCQLGTLSIYALTMPAVHWLGGGDARENELIGFPRFMALVGLLGAALWFVTYAGCKVRQSTEAPHYTIRQLLSALMQNRPWLVCTSAFGLSFINLCAYLSFAIYYAKYILHKDAEFGGYMLVAFTICALAGNIVVSLPALSRFAKKRRLQFGYLLQASALLVIALFPGHLAVFVPAYLTACFASGMGSPLYYAMIADAIDHGARTTGFRTAGVAYALNSLLQKVFFGLTGSMLAAFLSLGGYDAGAAEQQPGLVTWITAGYVWLPATISLLLIFVVSLYPDDDGAEPQAVPARGLSSP